MVAFYGRRKEFSLFYVFFNSKKQKGVKKMQNKKEVIESEIDLSVLDNEFFTAILNSILASKKEKEAKHEPPKN